jgi:glycosyltransferase involved in cell wall biosynthesis
MRILTLCYEFPPLGGGGSRVTHGLARELVRLGHEVTVVTMGYRDLPRLESVDGIEVHRVPGLRRRPYQCSIPEVACHLPLALARARTLHDERPFDLAHAHFILPDGANAWRLYQSTGLPYLITAHGSDVRGYDPHRLDLAHRMLAPVWRRIVESATAVTCSSDVLAQLVVQGSPGVEVQVVPNGLDVGRPEPARDRRPRVLVVAKMLERKGVQYLVRALEGMEREFEVDIVGDGPYLPEIRRLVAETGVQVHLWGWLDNDSRELADLFRTSSIFVFPSEAENFPVVLLEAMRAGLAIVTTRGTGCAEVVGDAALLVEPRDVAGLRAAMNRVATDRALRESLGTAARARIESNFSWTAVAKQYVDLYRRCLQSARVRNAFEGTSLATEPASDSRRR